MNRASCISFADYPKQLYVTRPFVISHRIQFTLRDHKNDNFATAEVLVRGRANEKSFILTEEEKTDMYIVH